MAKGNRKSASMSAGITSAQYNESLAKFAANAARINSLTAELEEELTAIRDQFDDDLNIISKEQELLMAVLKGYCVQNRADLFVDKKSIETLFGTIGFRKSTPSLKLLKGVKWEDVVINLKEHLPSYIRTIEEADKAKLLADRDEIAVAPLLPKLGVTVSQDEKFFIELKKEEAVAA